MGTEQILFSASIIVAFLSGVVALFAPCCITFLLPAYLGQILRVRAKIILGTLLFGLGVATVMLPVALGFRTIVALFQEYHIATYVAGGFLMMFFGVLTLLDKKLRLPFTPATRLSGKIELGSLYGLGIFGGLTSVCCAPVLAGALILAGISATLFKTIAVGFAYVAGIVFPLFIGALLFESNPLLPLRSFLLKPFSLRNFGIEKEITRGNLISGFAFIGFGVLLAALALLDKIAMPENTGRAGAVINLLILKIGQFLKNHTFLEYIFFILLIIFIIFFVKFLRKNKGY